MIDQEDNKLVRQTLDGNTAAFTTLVEKYQTPIYHLELKLSGDSDDAKDLTQDVFIKAYEKLNTFDFKYKFFSWLYRIGMNEGINFKNRAKRKTELDQRLPAEEGSPVEELERKELSNMMQFCLDKLKDEYQTLIIMKHYEGFSYEEIGEILELSEKTVKSRLYMARQQLKKIILDEGGV